MPKKHCIRNSCRTFSIIFSGLNTLDTEAIPPTATVLPLRSVMRDDVPRPSLPVDEILANAPARSGDSFEVRVILED